MAILYGLNTDDWTERCQQRRTHAPALSGVPRCAAAIAWAGTSVKSWVKIRICRGLTVGWSPRAVRRTSGQHRSSCPICDAKVGVGEERWRRKASVRRHQALQFLGPGSNNIASHASPSADKAMLFTGFRELKPRPRLTASAPDASARLASSARSGSAADSRPPKTEPPQRTGRRA